MSWQDFRHPFASWGEGMRPPFGPIKVIEQCFIRKDHHCGKMCGVSKSCFIACPSDEQIEFVLELVSEKLTKVGIEPIIAVKERAYGQDIFCTKICGKIIEAKFCLVVLDDSLVDSKTVPNPNVYYEYGLMTALQKHIIPLQRADLTLAFNIQSYDTIKYSSKNLGAELDRAIRDAIKLSDTKEPKKDGTLFGDKTILRCFELSGLEEKDDKWFLSDVVEDTGFKGFGGKNIPFYVYLGRLDKNSDTRSYLEDLNVVVYRTEKIFRELSNSLTEMQSNLEKVSSEEGDEQDLFGSRTRVRPFDPRMGRNVLQKKIEDIKELISLMSKIYVTFIIDPQVDRADFMSKAGELLSRNNRFELVCNEDTVLTLGNVVIPLTLTSA
jgi:hypothetical protein